MAILTLYEPGSTIGSRDRPVYLGNYIDLRSEEVRILNMNPPDGLSWKDELESAVDKSPGAILATGKAAKLKRLKVSVAFIEKLSPEEHIGPRAFVRCRTKYDIATYTNLDPQLPDDADPGFDLSLEEGGGSDGRPKEQPDWQEGRLAKVMKGVGVGTRMVVRFADPAADGGSRYFRVLVHRAADSGGHEYSSAFTDGQTALQFEELVKGRVIVPLGVGDSDDDEGMDIVTGYNLPAEHVTKGVPDVVWTLRHGGSGPNVNQDLYGKSFPLVRILFKEWLTKEIWEAAWEEEKPTKAELRAALSTDWRVYETHHPTWVGGVVRCCHTSRSYMNSTLRVIVSHGDRAKLEYRGTNEDGHGVRTYRYHLFMLDGTSNTLRNWDPPVEVDDDL